MRCPQYLHCRSSACPGTPLRSKHSRVELYPDSKMLLTLANFWLPLNDPLAQPPRIVICARGRPKRPPAFP